MKRTWLLKITALSLLFSVAALFAQIDFFDQVNYKGAFGMSNWMQGWTALDEYGFLPVDTEAINEVNITDASINAGEEVYWTADNVYVLDGLVYAEAGAVLNIEAGTVIKARAGSGDNASALVICQGAKIYAEGTCADPIIFTAYADDLADPYDVEFNQRGLWGGLIVLGKAITNEVNGIFYVEGISEQSERTKMGGNDDHDNSGVLRYISIRHAGTELAPGDEINGLTMGTVGDGTTIEYIEVFANSDDGYEWFGGTVNCKHLIAAFCGDDGFDHDQGIRSKMQYLFCIQDADAAGHAGEHDGGHDPEDGVPFAYPMIYNATFLGPGITSTQEDAGFNLRDNWGGEYKNSIFGDRSGKAIVIEDSDSKDQDSKKRLDDGEIVFENNLWFNFKDGITWDAITTNAYEAAYLSGAATSNDILAASPLRSISRAQDNGLDPRPVAGNEAYDDLADYTTAVEIRHDPVRMPTEISLGQNYPNPFNPTTTISYSVTRPGRVRLQIYNALGQHVATLIDGHRDAGHSSLIWNAGLLESGMYIYRLQAGSKIITHKMMLLR